MMQYRHLKNKVIMNLREIILTNLLQFIKGVYSTVDECGVWRNWISIGVGWGPIKRLMNWVRAHGSGVCIEKQNRNKQVNDLCNLLELGARSPNQCQWFGPNDRKLSKIVWWRGCRRDIDMLNEWANTTDKVQKKVSTLTEIKCLVFFLNGKRNKWSLKDNRVLLAITKR